MNTLSIGWASETADLTKSFTLYTLAIFNNKIDWYSQILHNLCVTYVYFRAYKPTENFNLSIVMNLGWQFERVIVNLLVVLQKWSKALRTSWRCWTRRYLGTNNIRVSSFWDCWRKTGLKRIVCPNSLLQHNRYHNRQPKNQPFNFYAANQRSDY